MSISMRETKKSQILRSRAKRLRTSLPARQHGMAGDFARILRLIFFRSLHMFFTEPIVAFTALHGAFAVAMFYVYYVALPYVMIILYGFTLKEVGLSFLPMVVGSVFAVPSFIVIEKTLYQKAKLRSPDKKAPPEARLFGAMIGVCYFRYHCSGKNSSFLHHYHDS